METLIFILAVIGFFSLLYFGCRKDYRRDPQTFRRKLLGIPLTLFFYLLGAIGLVQYTIEWIEQAESGH
ncbi:MAG: hypothetical protein AAF206_02245 [Bacteroidota bacterium]